MFHILNRGVGRRWLFDKKGDFSEERRAHSTFRQKARMPLFSPCFPETPCYPVRSWLNFVRSPLSGLRLRKGRVITRCFDSPWR